jgi:hypothetical protein
MIDQEILKKIYSDLDGTLGASGKEALQNLRSNDPEVNSVYQQLQQMHDSLTTEKDINLEIDLKNQILNKIAMENFNPSPEISFSERLQRIFFSNGFKIGFAFVLGIFLGIFLLTLIGQGTSHKNLKKQDIAGTMWDSRSYDEMKTADNIMYESPMAKATFNVKYSSKLVEMHIDINSMYPVKLAINFDPNAFITFNVQNINMSTQSTALSSYSYVEINNVGTNSFVVLLYNKNSLPNKINFTLVQNEMPLYSNSVTVNKD